MPMDRKKYPADWERIVALIGRRAAGRCECNGECGRDHRGRCRARNGKPHPKTGSRVVLTTAHLWRGPCAPCHGRDEKCGKPGHLKAMCQCCHLAYDLPHHVAQRVRNRHAKRAVADLFPDSH